MTTMGSLVPIENLLDTNGLSYGIVQPGRETPGGVPMLRVTDLEVGSRRDNVMRVDPDIEAKFRKTRLKGGELLLSVVGSPGLALVATPDMAGHNVARAIAVLRLREVESEWAALTFQTPVVRHQVSSLLNTTVQATLNLADVRAIQIPVPEAKSRQGILQVLGALDDKIAANRRTSRSIDDLAASIFTVTSRSSTIAFLSALADVNRTTIKPRSSGKLRYIDIAAVGVGDHEVPQVTDWAMAPGRARRAVGRGDVLWSTVRPNRRSHSLNLVDDPLLVASTGLAVLSPRDCGPAFLYEATRQPEFQQYLESVAEGSAYPAVRADEFTRAPIPVPDPQARAAFEERVGPLRELQSSLRQENLRLAATRDELLPLLMSGRITVEDAEQRVEQEV